MIYDIRTRAEKVNLVREFVTSKEKLAKYCRDKKLCASSFKLWVGKYGEEAGKLAKLDSGKNIAYFPDQQIKDGIPLAHLDWSVRWTEEHRPDIIVLAGDYADMPSLSMHDKAGSKYFEGKRYRNDIDCVNSALERQIGAIRKINGYNPKIYITLGNHCDRITRAINNNPCQLEGMIGIEDIEFKKYDITVVPFLEILELQGVWFSHYFYNQNSGRPYGGQVASRIDKVGNSFVQGHEQGLLTGHKPLANGRIHRGIVAGSFYLHDENYKGAQGNNHWRGLLMLENTKDGNFDLREFSMANLKDRYDR
jgi:hypothetical protein